MDKQASIFFVQLTYPDGGALLVNITDIMYVLPRMEGGSVIAVRDDLDNGLLCAEPPDRVGQLIQEAIRNNVVGLAQAAYRLAKEL